MTCLVCRLPLIYGSPYTVALCTDDPAKPDFLTCSITCADIAHQFLRNPMPVKVIHRGS